MESTNTFRLRKPVILTAMDDELRRRPFMHHVRGIISNHSTYSTKKSRQSSQKEMRVGQKEYVWVGGTDENEYETQTHLLKTSLLFRSHGLIQKKHTRPN